MNNSKDIYHIMARLTAYWQTVPHLRLEQILLILADTDGIDGAGAYYMEIENFHKALNEKGF